jgi:hypothetical protein
MSRVTPSHLLGLGVPLRYNIDTFSTTDTSATEAGPRPGSAVPADARSEVRVSLSGEQSDDLTVKFTQAGMPVLGSFAARAAYRKTSENASQTRGWLPPNLVRAWRPAEFAEAATATWGQATGCTLHASQKALITYEGTGGTASFSLYSRKLDPATWEWSSAVEITTTNGTMPIPLVLPNGRVLCIESAGNIWYSDDNGDTWAEYATRTLRGSTMTGTIQRGRAFMVGEEILLIWISDVAGTKHLYQFVSYDYGTSFTQVLDWSAPGGTPEVVALPSGRIGCVTINGSNLAQWRDVGSPYDQLDDATATTIDASNQIAEVTAYADYDGAVYVIGRAQGGENIDVWRSDDEGDSWVKFDFGVYDSGDSSTYPTTMHAVPMAGAMVLLHQWAASPATTDSSVGAFVCGGWSNVTTDRDNGTSLTDTDGARWSFGPTASAGLITNGWVPLDLPDDNGYALTGGATAAIAGGWLIIDSAGALHMYTPLGGAWTGMRLTAMVEVKVTANGSLTATDCGIEMSVANGVTDKEIEINMTDAAFRVRDVNAGSTLVEVTVDMTTAMLFWVLMDGTANRLEVYYARPGAAAWTLAYGGTMTNAGAPSASGHFRWGHLTATPTVTSAWRLVQYATGFGASFWESSASTDGSFDSPWGKVATLLPYPLGDIATAGATFISVTDGPARMNETHAVEVAHDHAVEKVLPDVSPSTEDYFETTSTAETIIGWRPAAGVATSLNSKTIAVAFLNVNFRTAYLEGYTGGAWSQIAEYDGATGFTGLTGAVSGDQVTPNGGIASRYTQRGEHVGATLVCNGTYAEILHHEEGLWTTATTRKPRYTVDRTITAGSAIIIARNGLLVAHNVTGTYERYRVRIPSQSTKDNTFRAGLIVPVGVALVGLPPSDGWAGDWDPRYRETEDERGTTRREELGPLRRAVTLNWSEGVPLYGLRSGTPNYLSGDSGHDPVGTHKDVPWLLAGLLSDAKSGKLPMVLIQKVPETSTYTTITDPTLWMLARPEGSVSFTQVRGAPGSEKLVRVQQWSFRELR